MVAVNSPLIKVIQPFAGDAAKKLGVKALAERVPVVSSVYGLGKTCIKVYNATTPGGALAAGVKGIVIDCSPPVFKYPALCTALLVCGEIGCYTGNPTFVAAAFECGAAIVGERE